MKILHLCAVSALCCILGIAAYSQTIENGAIVLTDRFGHEVKLIPERAAPQGSWVFEIPYSSPFTGSGKQTPQAVLDGDPFITFAQGSNNMTNNRILAAGSGISLTNGGSDNSDLTITNTGVRSLGGTTNQVNVSASTGAVTLSLPQNINTGAQPQFSRLRLTNLPNGSNSNNLIVNDGGDLETRNINSLPFAEEDDPLLTFSSSGAGNLGNYRRLTEGTGINLTNSGGNGGTFRIDNTGVVALSGTANQVSVSSATGSVTLSLPQNINTGAQPQFLRMRLTNLQNGSSSNNIVVNDGGDLETRTVASLPLAEDDEPIVTFGATGGLTNYRRLAEGAGIDIANSGGNGGSLTVTNTGVRSVSGTANQVSVSSSTGNVTFSLPQNINTSAQPQFARLRLSNMQGGSTATQLVVSNGGNLETRNITTVGVIASSEPFITFQSAGANLTNHRVATAGSGIGIALASGNGAAATISNTGVLSAIGTANQVNVSNAAGNVTFSLPQNIHTGASPNFAGLSLTGLASGSSSTTLLVANGGAIESRDASSLGFTNASEPIVTFSSDGGTLGNNRVIAAGSGIAIASGTNDNDNITLTNTGVLSAAGTANQIAISSAAGNVTFSLPQDIHTGANTEFANLTLNSMPASSSSTDIVVSNNGAFETRTWESLVSDDWTTAGNTGTVDGTDFIGTTDNVPLSLRVNNELSGRIEGDDGSSCNTGFGYLTLAMNSGTNNSAFGLRALNANASGTDNTAIGYEALMTNYGGFDNTALGAAALALNDGGAFNVAAGRTALYSNSSGLYNSAMGWGAMYANSVGSFNVGVGVSALYSNDDGTDNTAAGAYALYTNSTGDNNTALGSASMQYNTEGSYNAAFGYSALANNTTGSHNTAGGEYALLSNETGEGNTALGSGALSSNASGSHNSTLGYMADVANDDLENATAIGAYALAGADNALVLGSISGINNATANTRVGIGTTTPSTTGDDKLDVLGDIRLGASSSLRLYATGGNENLRVLRGRIDSGGSIVDGSGFTVAHTSGTGVYTVTVDDAFSSTCTTLATIYGATPGVVTVSNIDGDSCNINTFDMTGTATDLDFTILITGPR